jgi:inhibitor of KinA
LERDNIEPLGDSAIVVSFGDKIDVDTNRRVRDAVAHIEARPPASVIEIVPAFTTVTVTYDPLLVSYREVKEEIGTLLEDVSRGTDQPSRVVEIPVCYGGDLGPDLDFVASHNGLTPADVVAIHSEPDYLVYMIGFAPGFPYLGGMREKIATPRRDTPRTAVPKRSVGIGGSQTGVYPIESPGGWQLLGRTPLQLFRPDHDPPSLLEAGDTVHFTPISRSEYEDLLAVDDD